MFPYTYLLHEHTYMNTIKEHFYLGALSSIYLPGYLYLELRGWFISIYCVNYLSYPSSMGKFGGTYHSESHWLAPVVDERLRMSKVVTYLVVSDGTNHPTVHCCNSGWDVNLRRIIRLAICIKMSISGLTLPPPCCRYRGWGDNLRMFIGYTFCFGDVV